MKFAQKFVALDKSQHSVKQFDCGKKDMNQFLSRFSHKHAKLGLSRTMVLTLNESVKKQQDYKQVIAYYTIAASNVVKQSIPTNQSLPHYQIPIALLARLAVDAKFQGNHLGEKMLIYALRHVVRLCDRGLPAYGLVLDVLDTDALKFHQRFNFFHEFSDDPMRLFVPMEVLRKL